MSTLFNMAWDALKDGPKTAISNALSNGFSSLIYNGTSWTGIQIVESTKWLGSVVGDSLAQVPDFLANSLSSANSESDYFYKRITLSSTFVADKVDRFNKLILNTVAPNAEKAEFGFSELIGPGLALWFTLSYTVDFGLGAFQKINELTHALATGKEIDTSYSHMGKLSWTNIQKVRKKKLVRETTIYALATILFGMATSFLAKGIQNRLIEAGVNSGKTLSNDQIQLLVLGAVALPTMIPNFFGSKKEVKDILDQYPSKNDSASQHSEKTSSKPGSLYVAAKGKTTLYRDETRHKSQTRSASPSLSSPESPSWSPTPTSSESPFVPASRQSTLGRPLNKSTLSRE